MYNEQGTTVLVETESNESIANATVPAAQYQSDCGEQRESAENRTNGVGNEQSSEGETAGTLPNRKKTKKKSTPKSTVPAILPTADNIGESEVTVPAAAATDCDQTADISAENRTDAANGETGDKSAACRTSDGNEGASAENRTSDASLKAKLEAEIDALLGKDTTHAWQLGEKVAEYRQAGGKIADLVDLLKLRKKQRRRLYEAWTMVKVFPDKEARKVASFSTHVEANEQARKWKRGPKDYIYTAQQALEIIRNPDPVIIEKMVEGTPAKPVKLVGEKVNKYFRTMERVRREVENPPAPIPDDILSHCFHGSCVKFAESVPPESLDFINLDPPYGDYEHSGTGEYTTGAINTGRSECDNKDSEQAIQTTIASLKAYAPLLKPDGVLLLWQSYKTIRLEILQAIHDAGLKPHYPIIWAKRKPQPMNFGAFGASIEQGYLITRADIKTNKVGAANHWMETNRHQVINFDIVRQKPIETHQMQKPEDLCEFLLQKFCPRGGTVVDGFGCSGSMTIVAARLEMRWTYCESNESNYKWGSQRIADAVEKMRAERIAGNDGHGQTVEPLADAEDAGTPPTVPDDNDEKAA